MKGMYRMYQMWMNKRLLVVDAETDSLNATTIHVVVTKDHDTKEVKTFHDGAAFNSYINEQPSLFIMHNGISFDAPVLNRLWDSGIKTSQCIDTLLLSRLFNPIREGGHSSMLGARGLVLIRSASLPSSTTQKRCETTVSRMYTSLTSCSPFS